MINIDQVNPLLTEGVWTEFEGSRFLVTHMSNVAFQRAVMRRQAPYKSKIEKGTLDPAITRKLMSQAMADALVLDWKDVTGEDKQPVAFSTEACFKALQNHHDLRDFLSEFAMNLDNFAQEAKDKMSKS